MQNKKYQIFISSTFKDLKVQREKVIYAILNMGHLPSGMELFTAANEEQFEYIKRIIDDSDYYVLILGKCYGSISTKTGKSYTEMEYEYAKSKGIPILAFLCTEDLNLDIEDENKENINRFRKEVLNDNRLAKFWDSNETLTINIINSLNYFFDRYPQSGWIRENSKKQKDSDLIFETLQDYIVDFYPQIETDLNVRNIVWYEKYKKGKIRQGGALYVEPEYTNIERQLYLLQPYKTNNYSFIYNITNPNDDSHIKITLKEKNENFVIFKITNYRETDKAITINWLAEGF